MGVTPGYLESVASFYDLFRLEPGAATRCSSAPTSPAGCAARTSCSSVLRGRRRRRRRGRPRRRSSADGEVYVQRLRVPGRLRPRADGLDRRALLRAARPEDAADARSSSSAPAPRSLPDKALARTASAAGRPASRPGAADRQRPDRQESGRGGEPADALRPGSCSATSTSRACASIETYRRARRLPVARARRCKEIEPERAPERARGLRPARPRRRRLLDGQEGLVPAARRHGQVPLLQRRRVRARHLQGPRADAEEPPPADRGRHDRGARAPAPTAAFIFIRGEYAAGRRHPRRARSPRPTRPATSARTSSAPAIEVELVVHRGAGAYICGEETALLDSLEGKRGNPRLKPPFPAIQGLYGGPTLINNVETLSNVPHIVANGADWFKSFGTEQSPGHQGRLGLRLRAAARQLRDRARHPVARDHLRPRRRPARGPRGQGLVPRRLLGAGADRRGARPALQLRGDGRGRLDARLGRDHRRRRLRLDPAAGAADGALLPPRVVRQVHALPRGHQLDGEDARAGDPRRGDADGPRRSSPRSRTNIIGHCLCVLGDSMAMPVGAMVEQVPRRVRGGDRASARRRPGAARRRAARPSAPDRRGA